MNETVLECWYNDDRSSNAPEIERLEISEKHTIGVDATSM